MKRCLAALATTAIALTTAPPAQAQVTHACGGDSFWSCINTSVTTGPSSLTFTFTNVSGTAPANNPSSFLTELGVGTTVGTTVTTTNPHNGHITVTTTPITPTGISVTGSNFFAVCSVAITGCSGTGGTGVNPSSYNGQGLTAGNFFGIDAVPPSPSTGLYDNQSATFQLRFESDAAAAAFLSGIQYAIHDQGGLYGGCGSSKAAFSANGTPLAGSGNPANASLCNPATTTPEPSSLALLGTGLVGFVPMLRRRRK